MHVYAWHALSALSGLKSVQNKLSFEKVKGAVLRAI